MTLVMSFRKCTKSTWPHIFPILKAVTTQRLCAIVLERGLTANVFAKSNAIFLAGSLGRFSNSGLSRVRLNGYDLFEQLT